MTKENKMLVGIMQANYELVLMVVKCFVTVNEHLVLFMG